MQVEVRSKVLDRADIVREEIYRIGAGTLVPGVGLWEAKKSTPSTWNSRDLEAQISLLGLLPPIGTQLLLRELSATRKLRRNVVDVKSRWC